MIKDLVRGGVHFPPESLGDFILIRTEGFPVYNFSCAVDDGLMKISHVFRAEEHLPNTLKQKLIQEALAFPAPQTGHLSIILGKDRKKLSKRSGAESVDYYRKEGYLPSALVNFLALLGWNPKTEKELFSKEELIQSFTVEGLNRSAGIFDEEKLLWMNGEQIKMLSDEQILQQLKNYSLNSPTEAKNILQNENSKRLLKIISLSRSNFKTLKQGLETIKIFFDDPPLQESALPVIQWPNSKSVIEKWTAFLQGLSQNNLSYEEFKVFQKKIQDGGKDQRKRSVLAYPVRLNGPAGRNGN